MDTELQARILVLTNLPQHMNAQHCLSAEKSPKKTFKTKCRDTNCDCMASWTTEDTGWENKHSRFF